MKKSNQDQKRRQKLTLRTEVVAVLTPLQLGTVAGGIITVSGPVCTMSFQSNIC